MSKHLFCLFLMVVAPSVTFALNGATMGEMYAVLDIGEYIRIRNVAPIKIVSDESAPDPFTSFKGCQTIEVDCNFKGQLRAQAKAVSEAQGVWTATLTPDLIDPGTTQVEVCVAGVNVQTHMLMGGQKDVPVAEVTIQVIAR